MSIFDQIKALLDKGFILHNSGGFYTLEHLTSYYVNAQCSVDGFKFVLSFEPEDIDMEDHFIGQGGWSVNDYKTIKNYYWFCAKVTAYKGIVACGDSYLGGNCYKNKKDVFGDFKLTSASAFWDNVSTLLSGYGVQMIKDAIDEANENLETN